jgi:hypothetical protein
MNADNAPLLPMLIKVKPYAHQVTAFNFVCEMFGLVSAGGDSVDEGHGEMHPVRESIPTSGKPSP